MNTQCDVPPNMAVTAENGRSGFVNAIRVHNALTAKLEKRILTWMAQRMPAAIIPDHLTSLALACQIFAGAAYALSSWDGRCTVLQKRQLKCFLKS